MIMPFGQYGTDKSIGIDYAAMREYRLARVREMMEREGYGIFITWDAWNMRYLNGGYPTVPCRWAATMFSILCRNDEPLLSATTVMDPFRLKEYYPWMPADHVTKDIGGGKMIRGYVPLAEMFGYATDLRSRTQGRGNYSMFFEKYEQVPKSVQEKVLAAKSK